MFQIYNNTLKKETMNETYVIKKPVDSLSCPSLMLFESYMKNKTPVVLKNCVTHWPAIEKWRCLTYSFISSSLK